MEGVKKTSDMFSFQMRSTESLLVSSEVDATVLAEALLPPDSYFSSSPPPPPPSCPGTHSILNEGPRKSDTESMKQLEMLRRKLSAADSSRPPMFFIANRRLSLQQGVIDRKLSGVESVSTQYTDQSSVGSRKLSDVSDPLIPSRKRSVTSMQTRITTTTHHQLTNTSIFKRTTKNFSAQPVIITATDFTSSEENAMHEIASPTSNQISNQHASVHFDASQCHPSHSDLVHHHRHAATVGQLPHRNRKLTVGTGANHSRALSHAAFVTTQSSSNLKYAKRKNSTTLDSFEFPHRWLSLRNVLSFFNIVILTVAILIIGLVSYYDTESSAQFANGALIKVAHSNVAGGLERLLLSVENTAAVAAGAITHASVNTSLPMIANSLQNILWSANVSFMQIAWLPFMLVVADAHDQVIFNSINATTTKVFSSGNLPTFFNSMLATNTSGWVHSKSPCAGMQSSECLLFVTSIDAVALSASTPTSLLISIPTDNLSREIASIALQITASFQQTPQIGILDRLNGNSVLATSTSNSSISPSSFFGEVFEFDYGGVFDWEIVVVSKEQTVESRYFVVPLVALAVLLVSTFCSVIMTRAVGRPLERLAKQMLKISDLDFSDDEEAQEEVISHPSTSTLIHSKKQKLDCEGEQKAPARRRRAFAMSLPVLKEIQYLTFAMEAMKSGLKSFSKYVPLDVVTLLVKLKREAVLGVDEMCITVGGGGKYRILT